MIDLLACVADATVTEVVRKAFERSFTRGQIRYSGSRVPAPDTKIVVVLGPTDADVEWLAQLVRKGTKIVLLGLIGARVAQLAGINLQEISKDLTDHCACGSAPLRGSSESSAALEYPAVGLGGASPLRRRSLCRFDFSNEWNNLGYGRVDFGEGPWSIGVRAQAEGAATVSEIVSADGGHHGAAATLLDLPASSILWFARPVGPIDGPDWGIIEAFISGYRAKDLPCRPFLRDVPHGAAAAVTMRFDCDEAIASARGLFEYYQGRGIPMSTAVKTGQPYDENDVAFLRELFAAGGAILSHSVNHRPDWGGSSEAAESEARESKLWLEEKVPGLLVRYAVSPFHQTPTFVPEALARAGYRGFVAGTIAGYPQYLMARGGAVPFGPRGLISHTQNCMLHGDCLLSHGDPIASYREAFSTARRAGQFFGYFDHPFSHRYSYGWADEAGRQRAHGEFLDFMEQECANVGAPLLFVNEAVCLDFMLGKAKCDILFDDRRGTFSVTRTHAAGLPLSVGFQGKIQAVPVV